MSLHSLAGCCRLSVSVSADVVVNRSMDDAASADMIRQPLRLLQREIEGCGMVREEMATSSPPPLAVDVVVHSLLVRQLSEVREVENSQL
jgi:hypothetical protein